MRGVLSRGIGSSSADFARVAEELDSTKLFLVSRNGPTHFSIKDEEENVFKTLLGNPHSCSCSQIKASGTCVHLAFCILKVLRVPCSNPLASKNAYSDYELSLVISGNWQETDAKIRNRPLPLKRKPKETSETTNAHRQSFIDQEDVCPICQDEMSCTQALTWCRRGCGANIHGRCMETYAQFKISAGDKVKCPLCREPWDVSALRDDCREKPNSKYRCAAVSCHNCLAIQKGLFYRCIECSNAAAKSHRSVFDLCSQCFVRLGKEHREHHLVSSDASVTDSRRVQWRAVANPLNRSAALSLESIQALQTRDIGDDDYETLLSLDASTDLARHLSRTFPVAGARMTCLGCNGSSEVRQLPCRHSLCSTCLLRLVNSALGTDASALCQLSCPSPSCSTLLFSGLSRERKRSVNPAERADAGNKENPRVEAKAPCLSFGVAGTCLLPQTTVTATRTLPPIAVVRSYRQRVKLPYHLQVDVAGSNSDDKLPSLNLRAIVPELSMSSAQGRVVSPRLRRTSSRVFRGSTMTRSRISLTRAEFEDEQLCVNPSQTLIARSSLSRRSFPNPAISEPSSMLLSGYDHITDDE